MGYSTAYREVLSEYQKDRDAAEKTLKKRREDVYKELPRTRDIDNELKPLSIDAARDILRGGNESAGGLMEKSARLIGEKKALLTRNGYDEKYLAGGVYKCGDCRDTGYIGTEKCRCLKQRLIDKYYNLSSLKDILKRENFDTFDLRYYSDEVSQSDGMSPRTKIQIIFRTCLEYVENFERESGSLLFYGDTGLGKTFLCNCIAKDILDMGKTVLYVTAPGLFKIIENYRFNRDDMDEPDEYIDSLTAVDLLIIDDLGAEFSTVITSSELFSIINTRIIENRATIISTNIIPSDFEAKYSDRVISRLLGHYKMLKFIGDDIRVKKKYAPVGKKQQGGKA